MGVVARGAAHACQLSAADIASVVAVIVAALIGVVGLAIVLAVERHDRYRARLDETLAAVIVGLAARAKERDKWVEGDESDRGMWQTQERAHDSVGPLDVDLAAAVEVARLAGRRPRDRPCLNALSDSVVKLGIGSNDWQIKHSAELATSIRKWRSGEIRRGAFVAEVKVWGDTAATSLGKEG